ncbi:PPE family protein [Mycobacterium kansasii]|uniref:PPE family protein n=1 Tax=Mycobacterium kansasii TaxID=1768 RepID=A0A1V3XAM3_MYCKA|nr:PPE family protein [Mycobacterium kansasii]
MPLRLVWHDHTDLDGLPAGAAFGAAECWPGPAPLVAAAAQWSSLSAQYADTAEELSMVLAAVAAGAWQGPSAELCAAAYARIWPG